MSLWRTRGIVGAISAIKHMNPADALDLMKHAFNVFKDASVEGCGLFYDELATLVDTPDKSLPDKSLPGKSLPDGKLDWLYGRITDVFSDTVAVDHKDIKKGKTCFELNNVDDDSVCISLLTDRENRRSLPVLCPLVRLLCYLAFKKTQSLVDVDAILGAPIVLPDVDYDSLETLPEEDQRDALDAMFYCVNLFRELVNGFGVDNDYVTPLLRRLEHVAALEGDVARYAALVRDYVPPQTQFYHVARVLHVTKPKPKGKGKAGKKTLKKGSRKAKDDDINDTCATPPDKSAANADRTNSATTSTDISLYEQFLRPLEFRIFIVMSRPLKIGPPSEHVPNSISLKLTQLLLSDNLKKLNYFLVKKTNPFGRETSTPKFTTLAPIGAEEIATVSTKMLPYLRAKLTMTGDYCKNLVRESDGVLDSLAMFGPEATDIKKCYTLILQNILAIVSWPGYHSMRNKALLTKLIKRLSQTEGGSSGSTPTDVFTYFRKQHTAILHITAADTLIKLIQVLFSFGTDVSARKTRYLHELCNEFLTRRWMNLGGVPEQGLAYNRQVESILIAYMDSFPAEDKLQEVTQLVNAVAAEALTMDSKDDVLESFPAVSKSNFEIVYRCLFSALIDVAKLGSTLTEWKCLVGAYESLTDVLKKEQFQSRPMKLTFARFTAPYIKAFLDKGFLVVEKELRNHSQKVNDVLRTLQGSTRFAQNLIYDGKKLRDSTLVNYAPMMRLMLEKFIMRVKSTLTGENCGDAFFCGNLRNKDLRGELINSQSQSTTNGSQEELDNEFNKDDNDDADITCVNESDDDSDKVSSQSVMF